MAILLAGVPLLFGMVTTSFGAVLQSRLRMGRAVVGDVVGRACALGARGCVAGLDLGFYAVIGAAAGGALAPLVVVWLAHPPAGGGCASWPIRRSGAACSSSGLPLGLALAINAVYFRADTLIISLYEPFGQVGLYTLAYRILEVTLVLGTVFLNTGFPVLSEAVAHDEAARRRAIQSSSDLLVILGVPLVAGGWCWLPRSWSWWPARTSSTPPSRCESCSWPARWPG